MNADTFELIPPNALERGIAGHVEIVIQVTITEIAHGQSGSVDAGKELRDIANKDERRVQFVCSATQVSQLFRSDVSVSRLGKTFGAARQRLIGPEDQAPRKARRHGGGFWVDKVASNACRIANTGFGFDCTLIDCRWPYLKAQAGCRQNLA